MNTTVMRLIYLVISLFAMYLSSKGMSALKRLSTLAGSAMFVMSTLFIMMMVAASALTTGTFVSIGWSVRTFMPTFDMSFFTGLSILVFAVDGCEKISPYVNKIKDLVRDFSRGAVALAFMVAATAILEIIALGMTFDSNHIPNDLIINGAHYAFQKLGEYYRMGNFFTVAHALTSLVGQFSATVLSVDAPLRTSLDSTDSRLVSGRMLEKNEHGIYVDDHRLVLLIACVLIVIPAFGVRNVGVLVRWLVKVNPVCMLLHYLWVFVIYIALRKTGDKFQAEYRLLEGRIPGILVGAWCFIFTAFARIIGIYPEDFFQLVLSIITPFVLVGLGFILPRMVEREKEA